MGPSRLPIYALYVVLTFFAVVVRSASNEEALVGWQPNPQRRGALAILESCIFTIVACTWSIQHLNVPGPSDKPWRRLRRKLRWAMITVLLPEIVLAHAIAERAAAVASLNELRDAEIDDLEVCYVGWSWRRAMGWVGRLPRGVLSCCSVSAKEDVESPATEVLEIEPPRVKWSLTHSYYANMGGLRLGTTNGQPVFKFVYDEFLDIPINTRQFSYLRKKGVIQATPAISKLEIADKSKTDYFTKGLAVLQISWLVLSLIGRAARHLAISQLEIITVAFAACAIGTYGFAWNKPQDVNIATTIHVPKQLEDRDSYRVAKLQPKKLPYIIAGVTDSSDVPHFMTRIHDGNTELSKGYLQPISLWLIVSVMLFGAIHLSAWNFAFPSPAERTLWRIGSTAITVLPVTTLMNSFLGSMSFALKEEVEDFEDSIFTLWEDYYAAAGPRASSLPLPHPSSLIFPEHRFENLCNAMCWWDDRDRHIAEFRTYIAGQNTSARGRIRAENFEWLMSHVLEPRINDVKQNSDIWPLAGMFFSKLELLKGLRERNGASLSVLERTAFILDARRFGSRVLLVFGSIYVLFRLLIIVLALIGLRAMSDSVYDTTWARNIPSVQ